MTKNLIFCACFAFLFSCSSDDNNSSCTNTILPTFTIEDISDCNSIENITFINDDPEDYSSVYIVKNQQQLNALIETTCNFEIDFNRYDLIIGKTWIFDNTTFDYKIVDACQENLVKINIKRIETPDQNAIRKGTFQVLIPKKSNDYQVEISYTTSN